ncbi:hypothetical protein K491DRAFT_695477 [Lophiostoma macrostomum CBS 122681]|uniref:Lytic polysaccharide monooxygenase n=1 Tax=Lophiostoma macrostomum CBS 122681 TaxID=1314788 RepID=A0A6A6T0A3_9PLEO|nr:hypothetical protein K491DRAFT_695477 [Lophiostoma macrostomum CBS 122681]
MKTASALLFATAVAADYGYGSYAEESTSDAAYTTIYPGYDHEPVTVTSQYQTIPTYDADASTWSEYAYVSTVITDYDGNDYTVTNTDQPVTVYHESSTITHYQEEPTPVASHGYYPLAGANGTYSAAPAPTKAYYELTEEVHEATYKDLGPKALPGYGGSGFRKDPDHQPVVIKKYSNGKWHSYSYVFTYGAPKPSATTFENPGTYTLPASDVTVEKPTTAAVEAHQTYHAHQHVTYGGHYTHVPHKTTLTAPYGAYETHGASTKTIIKYKTITCPSAGKYTIVKPTTTSYDHDTTLSYPTTTHYEPGVYHHPRETVTITKKHQPYTCSYTKTHSYPFPSHYPTWKPSSTHSTKTKTKHHSSTKTKHHSTHKPTSTHHGYPHTTSPASTTQDAYGTSSTPSATTPYGPDPSGDLDYDVAVENYGTPNAGYVKRGGMLERRTTEDVEKVVKPRKALVGKHRAILV